MNLHPYNWQPDGPDALVHLEAGLAISRHVLDAAGLPAAVRVGPPITVSGGDNPLKRSFWQHYMDADSVGLDLDKLPYIDGGYRIDERAGRLLRHASEQRFEVIQKLLPEWAEAWTTPHRDDWYHFVDTRATVTKEGITVWWVLQPTRILGHTGDLRYLWVGFFTYRPV